MKIVIDTIANTCNKETTAGDEASGKMEKVMTQETKHTPTPWHLSRTRIGNCTIEAACAKQHGGGVAIATCRASRRSKESCDEADANAAFIVRACNAHEGFVRVCGKLMDDYEGKTSMSLEEFSALKEEMEALLAKARGEAA